MRLRNSSVRLLVTVSIGVAALLAALGFVHPSTSIAQQASLPCPGMMNVGPERQTDATVSVTARAEISRKGGSPADGIAPFDEVQLTASSTGSSKCIWIQRAGPGEEFTAFAIFVVRPDELPVHDAPGPLVGRYCYRFFAVSDLGSSEPSVSCVEISTPRRPLGPNDTPPGPPDTGSGAASDGDLRGMFAMLGVSLMGLSLIFMRRGGLRRRGSEEPEG